MYLDVWIQIDFTESFIIKTILTGLFHNNMLLDMFNHGLFLTEKKLHLWGVSPVCVIKYLGKPKFVENTCHNEYIHMASLYCVSLY